MSNQAKGQSSDRPTPDKSCESNQPSDRSQQQLQDESPDQSQIVDSRDLVYKGGYDRNPQEILGNPAVAPQMLSEGRDLRSDIFRETEETISDSIEDSDRSGG